MQNLAEAIHEYVRETRRLKNLPSSTETTFYPELKVNVVLKGERLPFDVITGTSEGAGRRRDMPDFVLGDSSLFVGVYGEVNTTEPRSCTWRLTSSVPKTGHVSDALRGSGTVISHSLFAAFRAKSIR
jgi:hypothetical protein